MGEDTYDFKDRCTITIAVPPETSPTDIDYALHDAGQMAKRKNMETGAVRAWAVYQDNLHWCVGRARRGLG